MLIDETCDEKMIDVVEVEVRPGAQVDRVEDALRITTKSA